jgi:hypothetical protein
VTLKGSAAKPSRKKGKLEVKFEVVYSPPSIVSSTKKGSTKLVRARNRHRSHR